MAIGVQAVLIAFDGDVVFERVPGWGYQATVKTAKNEGRGYSDRPRRWVVALINALGDWTEKELIDAGLVSEPEYGW